MKPVKNTAAPRKAILPPVRRPVLIKIQDQTKPKP